MLTDLAIDYLREHDIQSVFHYVPLHSAPMGRQMGRVSGELVHTDDIFSRLVRLPLWLGIEPHLDEVIQRIGEAVQRF